MVLDNTTYYVVGGGMSAIMTALRMQKAGYKVELICDQPDPRHGQQRKLREDFESASPALKSKGATFGGGPTRMVTATEGDVYLGTTPMYDMTGCFDHTVSEGGWLDRPLDQLDKGEREWVERRAIVDRETQYIEYLRKWYGDANLQGMEGWSDLYAEEQGREDSLFANTDFRVGVIRTYDKPAQINDGVGNYSKRGVLGAVNHTDTPEHQAEFEEVYPFLKSDHVVGALQMRGCTFNVQQFLMNALGRLENHPDNPATLRFSTPLTGLKRRNGKVKALVLGEGDDKEEITDPKYVSLHLGAYDSRGILDKTPAAGRFMGVSGLWAVIDRPEGMTSSMKIHFDRLEKKDETLPLTDLNLIIYGDKLIVGSGYIFTGAKPTEITEASRQTTLRGMASALSAVLKDFNPETDFHPIPDRHCTRSFTEDGLPRLDIMETTGGGRLTIYGGDNTGTTSIAPAAAELIQAVTLGISPTSEKAKKLLSQHVILRAKADEILRPPGIGPAKKRDNDGGPPEPPDIVVLPQNDGRTHPTASGKSDEDGGGAAERKMSMRHHGAQSFQAHHPAGEAPPPVVGAAGDCALASTFKGAGGTGIMARPRLHTSQRRTRGSSTEHGLC